MVSIHPTALVEKGVVLGEGTSVWDNVHLRGPSSIGRDCIIGEKTYIAYGVQIGDRVKINAFVYVCTAVTIEDGVMISAGVVFTNDRFPRATTADLQQLCDSGPGQQTLSTRVCEGATLGASSVIGNDLTIGRFAMIGMGSVVTRSVPNFYLVVGNPARAVGLVCRCGEPLQRFSADLGPTDTALSCPACQRSYRIANGEVSESELRP
jgi:UDP-2-acetamido-3-amino-2,3-dideoxy-glucuronate N-acetyltransferase